MTVGPLWVVYVPDSTLPTALVAFAIPRAAGSAVERNRMRRRLRDVVGRLDAQRALARGLYLFGCRPGSAGCSSAQWSHLVANALDCLSSDAQ